MWLKAFSLKQPSRPSSINDATLHVENEGSFIATLFVETQMRVRQ